MAAAPVFIGSPKTWMGILATANTNRDGVTGTYATVASAGTGLGSRIDSIRVIPTGTVTAGVVRLFLSDGTNVRLLKEVMITATTPSATVEAAPYDLPFPDGLAMPNGWSLKASTHNSETFNVIARGGDFT